MFIYKNSYTLELEHSLLNSTIIIPHYFADKPLS